MQRSLDEDRGEHSHRLARRARRPAGAEAAVRAAAAAVGRWADATRQRFTRRRRCPHCRHSLRLFPAPTACPGCGRQIYPPSDRRRRY